jgi:hypothetical protein
MQLRRDVYFEAADGLGAAVLYLSQVARADAPLGSTLPPPVSWFYKLHLVAKTETLIAFAQASNAVTSASVDLAAWRLRVMEVNDEIQLVKDNVDRIQRFQDDVRSETRLVMRETPSELSVKRLESLKQQMDDSRVETGNEAQKLTALTDEYGRRTRTLLEHSLLVAAEVQRSVRAAFLAARAELEISIDMGRLSAASSALDVQMSAKISELIKLIDVSNNSETGG